MKNWTLPAKSQGEAGLSEASIPADSLQLCVLSPSLFQDGDAGVGILPEVEVIGGFRLGGVTCHRVAATKSYMGQGA